MAELDFMSVLHKSTQRDYLARVNDDSYPKAKAAELAKKFAGLLGWRSPNLLRAIAISKADGKSCSRHCRSLSTA